MIGRLRTIGLWLASAAAALFGALALWNRGNKYKQESDEHEQLAQTKDEQLEAATKRPRTRSELDSRIRRM